MMTVSSLNTKIKSLLEATFMHVLVEGEVGSVTYHSSGHLYFSIKDKESTLRCVMWRSGVAKMKFRLEQGMHIVIEGSVGVYVPRGEYQFYAVKIEPYGQGALAIAFEQLKERLRAKGYFDAHRKKAMPRFPKRIAIVTAKESAALQDMLKVAQKRWPLIEIVVIDTLVQGEQAAAMIARGLRYADTLGVDVVVTGRGGGSKEDLWAFNEEIVADAIFAMQTPVVSAVGHEVDTLISDFVADLRAPTPSAAMEMILPDQNEWLYTIDEMGEGFRAAMVRKLGRAAEGVQHLMQRLSYLSPYRRLTLLQEHFEAIVVQFRRRIEERLRLESQILAQRQEMLGERLRFTLMQKEAKVKTLLQRLESFDPRKGVKRGWVQLTKAGKKIALCDLKEGDEAVLTDVDCKAIVGIKELQLFR